MNAEDCPVHAPLIDKPGGIFYPWTCDCPEPAEPAPKPIVRATRYEVSLLHEDFPDADMWTLVLEYRGRGQWAVRWRSRLLGADGTWSYGFQWKRDEQAAEPVTDAEIDDYNAAEDAWRAAHRFDETTALKLAREAAHTVAIRGITAAQVAARRAASAPAG